MILADVVAARRWLEVGVDGTRTVREPVALDDEGLERFGAAFARAAHKDVGDALVRDAVVSPIRHARLVVVVEESDTDASVAHLVALDYAVAEARRHRLSALVLREPVAAHGAVRCLHASPHRRHEETDGKKATNGDHMSQSVPSDRFRVSRI
jgi:hypothetical protein